MELIEIFPGIDGEVNVFGQGRMSVFVRFAGCPCRCTWCDVLDKSSKFTMDPKEIIHCVNAYNISKVTITGGEPLLQDKKELAELFRLFKEHKYAISLETSGAVSITTHDLSNVDSVIMDYKLPSSGEFGRMDFSRLNNLETGNDFVKFVVADEHDYNVMLEIIGHIRTDIPRLLNNIAVSALFGPANIPTISPKRLLDKMIADKLDCYLNVQIHKLIGVR